MTERLVVGEAATPFIPTAATEFPDVPDTILDYGSVGGLQLRAASVRGYGHRYSAAALSTPRQDDYCFRLSEDGRWFVAVVCDGVSAGKDSHYAASAAARSCSRFVLKHLSDNPDLDAIDWDLAVKKTAQSIVREYKRRTKTPLVVNEDTALQVLDTVSADMATTAIAIVVDLSRKETSQAYAESQLVGEVDKNPSEDNRINSSENQFGMNTEAEPATSAINLNTVLAADEKDSALAPNGDDITDIPATPMKDSEGESKKVSQVLRDDQNSRVYDCRVVNLAGDSSIWKLNSEGWHPLFAEKQLDTAIASNKVHPLPALSAPHIASVELLEGESIFLMTDGVGDPLQDGKGELGQVLKERWKTPPDQYQFASDVDFSRRSYDDDRTVLGVWYLQEEKSVL